VRADAVKQKTGFGRIIGKVLLYFFTFLLVILIGLVGAVAMIDLGPSPAVRDLFVVTVTQTSAGGFLASMFLDEATIAEIIEKNSVAGSDEITDGDNVVIGGGDENYDLDKIEVFDVTGPTYKGKMMVVNDPSRVFVGSIPDYTVERGNTVQEIVAMYDGVAGVNGGGFEDIAGRGKGATPLGLVISQGEWLNGYAGQGYYHVVGFNQEDKLVVGYMTGARAKELGLRDAVAFGPALIINGEPVEVTGSGGGLNPRTALGQRADGAVLILVIDGRQPNSLGASFLDIIEIMQEYGAVNCGNLDGGTSSNMVYNNEVITNCCSLYGPRDLPTAIVVK